VQRAGLAAQPAPDGGFTVRDPWEIAVRFELAS
jgi:hypothetical protein